VFLIWHPLDGSKCSRDAVREKKNLIDRLGVLELQGRGGGKGGSNEQLNGGKRIAVGFKKGEEGVECSMLWGGKRILLLFFLKRNFFFRGGGEGGSKKYVKWDRGAFILY